MKPQLKPMREIVAEQISAGNKSLYYFSRRYGFVIDNLTDWANDDTVAYITPKGYIHMQRHDGTFCRLGRAQ